MTAIYDLEDCHMGVVDMTWTNAAMRLLHANSIFTQTHSLLCMHVMMCEMDILVVGPWLLQTVCKVSPQGSPLHLTGLWLLHTVCKASPQKSPVLINAKKHSLFVSFLPFAEPGYTFASPQVWP